MPRVLAIAVKDAEENTKAILEGVQKKLGMAPNLFRTLANSQAALEGYLKFEGALATGGLDRKVREQIALAVAQANECQYCLSAHTLLGKSAGLGEAELRDSRSGASADPKVDAMLRFALSVVKRKGGVSDADLARVREAGVSDAEIVEIVAHVALNILTNYINLVAQTEVDFPKVELTLASAA